MPRRPKSTPAPKVSTKGPPSVDEAPAVPGEAPRQRPQKPPAKKRGRASAQVKTSDGQVLTGEILDDEAHDAEPHDEEVEIDLADLGSPQAHLPDLDGDGDGDGDDIALEDDPHATTLSELVLGPAAKERSYSLVKTDPLTAYMQEIRRYPLLTRDEEHELAVQFAKHRDPKVGRRLVTSNLRLVVKLAHEYRRAYRNLLDLVQEGNLGLLQAVQKYDPYRGVKLSSYAAWWIRAYMLKFILNNWRLVKIGTTQAQRKLFFNLSKERDKLESAGIAATNQRLAESLSVPEREVADMQLRLGSGEMSLDAPVSRDEEGGRTQVDMLESSGDLRPDVTTEGNEFRDLLHGKLKEFEKGLKGREQTLFRDRLISDQPLTLQEVGERYAISRERARQIEARLMARLKIYLKRELGDAVQVAMGLEE